MAVLGVAYAPVADHQFLRYDDDVYVTANPAVRAGYSAESVAWAFTSGAASNWQPLTWLSLMLDAALFGDWPGGYHLHNVLLHAVATLLLLALLVRMTGRLGPSALVAALFGLHPLHVESVAWVAERKDVLSTCLWFGCTLAWVGWVARPRPGRWLLAHVLLALGLMAKPMLVTLPATLLLLDAWPLGRVPAEAWPPWSPAGRRVWQGLVREKLGLFALAAVSAVVTFVVQRAAGAVRPLDAVPLDARMANAVVAAAGYLGQMVWPVGLTFFHPLPEGGPPRGPVVVAVGVLLALTALAMWNVRRRPYLLVGWLWYLGTLVPVIGLVQVGEAAMADRYTYVPLVGVFVALAWLVADWAGTNRQRQAVVGGLAVAVLVVLSGVTRAQVSVWRDDVTLGRHGLALDRGNYKAHSNLGLALLDRGEAEEAVYHLEQAVTLAPSELRHFNLATAYLKLGDVDRAAAQFDAALARNPESDRAHNNLAQVLLQTGEPARAIEHYRRAIALRPDAAVYRSNLCAALHQQGDLAGALQACVEALRREPGDPAARANLELVRRAVVAEAARQRETTSP